MPTVIEPGLEIQSVSGPSDDLNGKTSKTHLFDGIESKEKDLA